MYTWLVDGKSYDINIRLRDQLKMEKKGININSLLMGIYNGNVPTVSAILDIVQFGIQEPKYRTDRGALEELYWDWIEKDGHKPFETIQLLSDILKDCGWVGNEEEVEEDSKN